MFGRSRIKDGVEGSADVLAMAPTEARRSRVSPAKPGLRLTCKLELRVTLPGCEAYDVAVTAKVPHAKMPWTGMTVPVNASQADPERVEILWDRMEDAADRRLRSGAAAEAGDPSAAAEALGFKLKEEQ